MFDVGHFPSSLDIGYTGEKDFRKIEIDMSAWAELIPQGTPKIYNLAPSANALNYPSFTYSNNILTWTVSSTDLGTVEGIGLCQFELKSADRCAKSPIIKTNVHLGMTR